MKYKTKLFSINTKQSNEINDWLSSNPNITIISTNTFANNSGWGYIILYKNKKTWYGYSKNRRENNELA